MDVDIAALGAEALREFGQYKHPSWCQGVTTFTWLLMQASKLQKGFS